ncbi:hypothetical protein [Glaciibacter psychrotolerans]|uniref:Uncharacterized protein n=1 Tax=Glaciibacter psychrotolerans TaxID=670054 RepID=A0A7Z0J4Q5_9MICO|nr:hypothetical protein [Leifsonia psychrotolerans]NYJ18575.1 hypothetical protein [Leifsonia psychrotolerans]
MALRTRPARAWFVGALIATTVLLTFGGFPVMAQAATVSTLDDLKLALSPGTDSITLTADVYAYQEDLVIDRDVSIDLAGYVLMTRDFTVTPGTTLTLLGSTNMRSSRININGILQLYSDLTMQPYSIVTVGTRGSIVSAGGPFTVSGAQTIDNQGTITANVGPAQAVTGNNFTLRFWTNTPAGLLEEVTVFAPTLEAAGMSLPTFARVHAAIAEWNSEQDGSGSQLRTETALSTVGYWGTFHAQWVAAGITNIGLTYSGSPGPAQAGHTAVTALDTSPGGNDADISDLVDFSSANPDDSFLGSGFDTLLVAEIAGTRLVTAALRDDPVVSISVPIEVTHSNYPGQISLAVSPSSVTLGGTSTAYLSATDRYGNAFGYTLLGGGECDDCNPTVTSSVPGDVIDPTTGIMTFSSVGPRTITATVQTVEGDPLVATAVVTVTGVSVPSAPPAPPAPPAATPPQSLAATGSSAGPIAGLMLLALLGGLGALLLARGRTARLTRRL